jgi:hypothetical protein
MNILFALPALFIFLSASLVWLLIGSKGIWWIKLTMLIVTPLLAVWAWASVDNALGFPKETSIDQLKGKTATLFFQVVDEPKAIFLWVKMDDEDKMRVYQLPYSRALHEKVDENQAGDKHSERIRFGGGEGNSGEFYVLPPPLYPQKTP